ncbi:DUF3299 domain-containing protein [Primorskyibacter sp. S87]|uniref:DUF3299 domain-containing protein n=1 Tax=Primorskyibacter sp. S87 TaxID=3415126 RepID=UPI003C7C2615
MLRTLGAAGVFLSAGAPVRAEDSPIEIDWSDLVPKSGGETLDKLRARGVIQHGEMSTPFDQETGGQITNAYNGKLVRIPGYLVPLDYEGTGVTAALLVPYVGACVHVPPPPPNQLIYVTTSEPYESSGLFEPVYITGVFGTAATATQLAEVGYALSADLIEPYG